MHAHELAVRPATPADAPSLASLRFAFRASIGTVVEQEEVFVVRCAEWMATHLTDAARWRAWILERGEKPVGNVWLQLVEKLPNPVAERERHGYITNLYVQSEHRGSGGGSQLLLAAIDECRRLEVDTLILWPTPRSRPLYERHGFVATTAIMALSL